MMGTTSDKTRQHGRLVELFNEAGIAAASGQLRELLDNGVSVEVPPEPVKPGTTGTARALHGQIDVRVMRIDTRPHGTAVWLTAENEYLTREMVEELSTELMDRLYDDRHEVVADWALRHGVHG